MATPIKRSRENASTTTSEQIDIDPLEVGNEPSTASLFDLDALRAPQEYEELIGVQRALVVVPVRKPHRQEWIRVHPDPAYRMPVFILPVEAERADYIVAPAMLDAVGPEARRMMLLTAMNRQQDVFLWPVRLPCICGFQVETFTV